MGRDKALLSLADAAAGETLVARAARCLASAVADVVIADRGRAYLPGFPSVTDGPGRGPAAALLGAAAAYPGRPLLALACDLPAVPPSLLRHLAALALSAPELDAALPEGPRGIEPLCALWGPRALATLARQVAGGRFALHPALADPELRIHRLDNEALRAFGDPAEIFRNLNQPSDLETDR